MPSSDKGKLRQAREPKRLTGLLALKQTGAEPDMPESEYFTHLAMLSALPYASMPAASSYTMHAKYSFSGSAKF